MQLGTKAAKGVFAPIIEAARKTPGWFTASETAAGVGAGVAAGTVEASGGGPTARMYGEMVGSMLPSAFLLPVLKNLGDLARHARSIFTKSGKRAAAGKRVADLLTEAGEDVGQVTRALEGPSPSGAQLTAAQKAGSPTLRALEERLIAESRKLGGDIADQTGRAVADIHEAMRRAIASGDPAVLREVARTRRAWFEGLLDARIKQANGRIAEIAGDIQPGDAASRKLANTQAREILESALSEGRKIEGELWGLIPDTNITATKTPEVYAKIRGELLPEEALPAPIEAALSRLSDDPATTSAEMLRLRNRTLAAARRAGGQGDFDLRRHLNQIADGLLDDLDQIPGDVADQARAFSRAFNDKFRRTSASEVLGYGPEGGQKVPPELTLERTMRRGGPEGAVKAEGLETAVAPIEGGAGRYAPESAARPEAMRATQEQFLRDVVGELVDPATGTVTHQRLAKWRGNNRDLLKRHPDLEAQLKNAEAANKLVKEITPIYKRGRRVAQQRAAFSKVADIEDPVVAFTRALAGDTPIEDVSGLFRLSARGGTLAKAGARGALFEALLRQGTRKGGVIDVDLLEGVLLRGPIHDAAVKAGVLTKGHVKALDAFIGEITKFNNAVSSGKALDDVLDPESAIFDIVARITGANIGGMSGLGQAAGSPLVLAQAGSQRMRALINKLPREAVTEILIEAAQDPQAMATLLRGRSSKKAAAKAYNTFVELLYRAGIERPAIALRIPIGERDKQQIKETVE